jgi:hypothetical protein
MNMVNTNRIEKQVKKKLKIICQQQSNHNALTQTKQKEKRTKVKDTLSAIIA